MKMIRTSIPLWFPKEPIEKLVQILGGNAVTRIVGGTVRDILMNRQHTDVDLATILEPDAVQQRLHSHHIKTIPTGLKHGTVTAVFQSEHICEITTLRRDIEHDGRRATVQFTDRWDEDAARRDFTINAMFMDLDGNVYDYNNGLQDIPHSIVRFVGDPSQRIQEDALRILRYFRLLAVMGLAHLDHASMDAAVLLAANINNLSKERVRQEMYKLLTAPFAASVLQLMLRHQIGQHIGLSNIQEGAISNLRLGSDYLANLAAVLLTHQGAVEAAESIVERWRISNRDARTLQSLCASKDDALHYPLQSLQQPANIHHRQIYAKGTQFYLHYIQLLAAQEKPEACVIAELEAMAATYHQKKLPITGHDLMEIGMKKQAIGQALAHAKKLWMESDFKLSHKELLQLISDACKHHQA